MEKKRNPKIGIIGGGLGGICVAIQLEKQLGIKSWTIFDENEGFGGTWLVNTYPGCACDVHSHLYSFSFEQNPNWSTSYASQQEIYDYILKVADKYQLNDRARFSTQVKSVDWDDDKCQWVMTVLDKNSNLIQNLHFDFVVTAVGGLRSPNIPSEFTSFKGPLMHSAQWNDKVDFKDKRVAIIGSGASAIQLVPALAPIVKRLDAYQRNPAWVQPKSNYKFSGTVKTIFKIFPFILWLFRCLIFLLNEFQFNAFLANSFLNRLGTLNAKKLLRRQIPDNTILRRQLTPDYKLGCKRVVISDNYFEAFNLPQVHLYREGIEKVEGQTITTVDGVSREVDILVLATGFRVQEFFLPMTMSVRNKLSLLEYFENNGPQMHYGIMSNKILNGFFILGPNTGLGHNSVIFIIECQVNYIMQVLKETIKRRSRTVTVKEEAQEKFMKRLQEEMKKTVWGTEKCGSWYADEHGVITVIWPFSAIRYYRETRNIDLNDFEFYD